MCLRGGCGWGEYVGRSPSRGRGAERGHIGRGEHRRRYGRRIGPQERGPRPTANPVQRRRRGLVADGTHHVETGRARTPRTKGRYRKKRLSKVVTTPCPTPLSEPPPSDLDLLAPGAGSDQLRPRTL